MEWRERALQLADQNVKPTPMFRILSEEYPDEQLNTERIRSYVRNHVTQKETKQARKPKGAGTVGIIGDLHVPFDHPGYLPFLLDTFSHFGVDTVVSIGDLVDHHAMSRHQTETCALGALDELGRSIKRLKDYSREFPRLRWCMGNHDEIPKRQAATVNVDERYLKSLHDVLELPDEWVFDDEFIIDDVLYKHGTGCGGGKYPYANTALKERISTVMGHYHSKAGYVPMANKRDLIFGLGVGCGIDIKAYAFAYGKHINDRPVLGCGIVHNSTTASFIPMPEKYFRD